MSVSTELLTQVLKTPAPPSQSQTDHSDKDPLRNYSLKMCLLARVWEGRLSLCDNLRTCYP